MSPAVVADMSPLGHPGGAGVPETSPLWEARPR